MSINYVTVFGLMHLVYASGIWQFAELNIYAPFLTFWLSSSSSLSSNGINWIIEHFCTDYSRLSDLHLRYDKAISVWINWCIFCLPKNYHCWQIPSVAAAIRWEFLRNSYIFPQHKESICALTTTSSCKFHWVHFRFTYGEMLVNKFLWICMLETIHLTTHLMTSV